MQNNLAVELEYSIHILIEPTFGNVLNENIQYIWVKMSKAINGPHCQCIAKNCDICKQLPRFYKLMRGYKK